MAHIVDIGWKFIVRRLCSQATKFARPARSRYPSSVRSSSRTTQEGDCRFQGRVDSFHWRDGPVAHGGAPARPGRGAGRLHPGVVRPGVRILQMGHDLRQRHVRRLLDQGEDRGGPRLDPPRAPVAALPPGPPVAGPLPRIHSLDRRRRRDPELLRRAASRQAAFHHRRRHAATQIVRKSSYHTGWPPSPARSLNHELQNLGKPQSSQLNRILPSREFSDELRWALNRQPVRRVRWHSFERPFWRPLTAPYPQTAHSARRRRR